LRGPAGQRTFRTTCGRRVTSVFYEASDADPQVIATDDATKDQPSLIGFGIVLTFGDEIPEKLASTGKRRAPGCARDSEGRWPAGMVII